MKKEIYTLINMEPMKGGDQSNLIKPFFDKEMDLKAYDYIGSHWQETVVRRNS